MMNKPVSQKIALCSVMVALSLVLSFFENLLLPALPIPGIKLGLANIVTLFLLYSLSPSYAATVLLARCALSALFGGGVTAFIFSITGGFLALFLMLLAIKSDRFSILGVSIVGASAHSIGQIFAASLLFLSTAVFMYLPVMLFVSLLTGALVAFVTNILLKRFKMFKK